MKKEFPDKSDKELKDFFTKDKPITKGWNTKDKARALELKRDFTGTMVFNVFTPDGSDMNYKKNSFPVLYNEAMFIEMLSDAIGDLKRRLKTLESQHKSAKTKKD